MGGTNYFVSKNSKLKHQMFDQYTHHNPYPKFAHAIPIKAPPTTSAG
jgi:hypothetical protein